MGAAIRQALLAPMAWTPTLEFATSQPVGMTFDRIEGKYVRLESIVFLSFFIDFSSIGTGGAGALRIKGVPYSMRIFGNNIPPGPAIWENLTLITQATQVTCAPITSGSYLQISVSRSAGGLVSLTYADLQADTHLSGQTYYYALPQ
jgi:hypothetical protein